MKARTLLTLLGAAIGVAVVGMAAMAGRLTTAGHHDNSGGTQASLRPRPRAVPLEAEVEVSRHVVGGRVRVDRALRDPALFINQTDERLHGIVAHGNVSRRVPLHERWAAPGWADRLYLPYLVLAGSEQAVTQKPKQRVHHSECDVSKERPVGEVSCRVWLFKDAEKADGSGAGEPATRVPPVMVRTEGIHVGAGVDADFCGFPHGDVEMVSVDVLERGLLQIVVASGAVFRFVPECRDPTPRWHGKNGWAELLAYHVGKALFGKFNTVPCATGVRMTVPNDSAFRAMFAARCGLDRGPNGVEVVGFIVAPPALAPADVGRRRRVNNLFLHAAVNHTAGEAQYVGDVTDILLLDGLLGHADRKMGYTPWNVDTATGRLVPESHPWALIGESRDMCSVSDRGERCPRGWSGLTGRCGEHDFCHIRGYTFARVNALLEVFHYIAVGLVERLLADPAMQWLMQHHNTLSAPKSQAREGGILVADALGRSVLRCPNVPRVQVVQTQPDEVVPPPPYRVLEWAMVGLKNRLVQAAKRFKACRTINPNFRFLPPRNVSEPYPF
eukprot:TRINITY_DN25092_c0_g1_i1.p1 TRINITY_DN25092_c0_g1~~TRINITY_DN25092_c0_g1_i1.p1  ORF type:complete len:557 (+),score=62.38 TRINITY_DN25092_c0_g1_i1:95-1765(+)